MTKRQPCSIDVASWLPLHPRHGTFLLEAMSQYVAVSAVRCFLCFCYKICVIFCWPKFRLLDALWAGYGFRNVRSARVGPLCAGMGLEIRGLCMSVTSLRVLGSEFRALRMLVASLRAPVQKFALCAGFGAFEPESCALATLPESHFQILRQNPVLAFLKPPNLWIRGTFQKPCLVYKYRFEFVSDFF